MTIEIDLSVINKYLLTPNQYVILHLLNEKEYKKIDELIDSSPGLKNSVGILEEKGWLKIGDGSSEYIVLRDPAIKLFNATTKVARIRQVSSWIEDWRQLFPVGYKGDNKGCIAKMKAFIKDYPSFSKEEIIQATKAYIAETKITPYLSQAHYFIRKDGISKLAAECEKLREGKSHVRNSSKTTF